MKILISSCVRWWNAEAAYAAVLADGLRAEGHQVHVLTRPGTRNHDQLSARGLPVITAPRLHPDAPWRWPGEVRRLRRWQQAQGIELVDVFHAAELPLHLLAARGAGGPAVVRTRGTARPVSAHALNRAVYNRWCAGVITSAELLRRELLERLGTPPERVSTIHYPALPVPAAQPGEAAAGRAALLRGLHLPDDALLVGIVGRVAREKGHRVLLEAWREVAGRHPRAVLLIVAKGYPGEAAERAHLEALVGALGLAERVRWLGFREDLPAVMRGLDVGVVPSLSSELNCRVAMEFFAAGTPVAAFPTGALPEVIAHGESGLLAPDHSAPALAGLLGALLGDGVLRERLGRGAAAAAAGRFAPRRFLTQTLAVYEAALARRRGSVAQG